MIRQRYRIARELIAIIMLMGDDPITYREFALCNWFTASVARTHLRKMQRKLKQMLPPLMMRSSTDEVRKRAIMTSGYFGALDMINQGFDICAGPIEDWPGGILRRTADIIEIICHTKTRLCIGGHIATLMEGRWMIPIVCLTFQMTHVGPCQVQSFYFKHDLRHALTMVHCAYQKLGPQIVKYGLLNSRPCDHPEPGYEWDGCHSEGGRTFYGNERLVALQKLVDIGILENFN